MSSVKAKRLIISLWLHFFLQRIGSKHPEFLSALLNDIDAPEHKIKKYWKAMHY